MTKYKPYLAFVVLFVLVVTLSLTFVYIDRERRQRAFEQHWSAVRLGMSQDVVRELLGEPDSLYPAGIAKGNSFVDTLIGNLIFDSMREKWAYGERRLLALGFDAFLLPQNDDRVVYFSSDGKVVKKLYPYREPEPTTTRAAVSSTRSRQ
jgi:hypothetical protein